MSVKIMSLVLKRGPEDHTDFVVLLSLGSHANDAGDECWPSVKTIAGEMRIGERSVVRSLKDLESDGWISVTRKSRDHKGNSYRIALARLASGATVASDSHATLAPDHEKSRATVASDEEQVTRQPVQSQTPNTTESHAKCDKVTRQTCIPSNRNRPEPSINRPEPSRRTQAFVPPDWVPIEPWNHFLEMRVKNRKPPTDHAKHLLIEKLARLVASGQDPGEILDQSTENGWAGLFELKSGSGNGNGNRNFNRAQEAVDSTLAGGRAALASFGFDCGPLDEIGLDDGRADGQGRGAVTIDGRRTRGLAGG